MKKKAPVAAVSPTHPTPPPGHMPAAARELVWAGLGIVLGLAGLTAAAGALLVPVRDLWLDEICTWVLTTDPSAGHALQALLHGVDSNPPALYAILRGLHAAGMPLNEVTLRLFSALSLGAGLLGCYAVLRRTFDRVSSGAAVAVLLGADIVLRNAFEARFYDPWLAISAWLCVALALRREGRGLGAAVAVAVLVPVMLTIHYFGLFTLGLVVAADFLADTRALGVRLRNRWPLLTALPGLGVVLYCYGQQRAAFTVAKSWIDLPTWSNTWDFLKATLVLVPLAAVAGVGVAAWLVRKKLPVWREAALPKLRPVAGMAGLALLPLVVLAFSAVVQPASVPRYALPGVAGVAVAAAVVFSRLRPVVAVMVAAGCLGLGLRSLATLNRETAENQEEQSVYMEMLAKAPRDELIVCARRHDFYPLVLYRRDLGARAYLLDFADGEVPDAVLRPSAAFCYVERDASRAVAAYYPEYQLITRRGLPADKPFLFIGVDGDLAQVGAFFHTQYVQRVVGRLYEVRLEEMPPPVTRP